MEMSGPVFYNLATLASIFLFFFACFLVVSLVSARLVLVVSFELVISAWSFQWLPPFGGCVLLF